MAAMAIEPRVVGEALDAVAEDRDGLVVAAEIGGAPAEPDEGVGIRRVRGDRALRRIQLGVEPGAGGVAQRQRPQRVAEQREGLDAWRQRGRGRGRGRPAGGASAEQQGNAEYRVQANGIERMYNSGKGLPGAQGAQDAQDAQGARVQASALFMREPSGIRFGFFICRGPDSLACNTSQGPRRQP